MKRFWENESLDISDEDIIISCKNLSRLDNKQKTIFESRNALIKELAFSICSDINKDDESISRLFLSSENKNYTIDNDSKEETIGKKSVIEKYFNGLSVIEQFTLFNEISININNKKLIYESILGKEEPFKNGAEEIIAYVKNNYTDEAFFEFSKILNLPRYINFGSFETVCENVYDGKSEYCILPLESTSDGRLLSFYSMIDRYELKIVSTCVVEQQEDQKFIKFALLRKSIASVDSLISSLIQSENGLFEMRFTQSVNNSELVYKILEFAHACSMKLLRIDSIPLPYSDNLISYSPVFSIYKSDFLTFLTYLTFKFPQCYAVGLYLPIK